MLQYQLYLLQSLFYIHLLVHHLLNNFFLHPRRNSAINLAHWLRSHYYILNHPYHPLIFPVNDSVCSESFGPTAVTWIIDSMVGVVDSRSIFDLSLWLIQLLIHLWSIFMFSSSNVWFVSVDIIHDTDWNQSTIDWCTIDSFVCNSLASFFHLHSM